MVRRIRVPLLAALLIVSVPALAAAAGVSVKPRTGGAMKRFAVSFRAPDAAGATGAVIREYIVSAQRHGGARCSSTASDTILRASAGQTVTVRLDPRHGGHSRWCAGVFHGQVEELARPVCVGTHGGPAVAVCPLFAILEKRIGRFTFRVR